MRISDGVSDGCCSDPDPGPPRSARLGQPFAIASAQPAAASSDTALRLCANIPPPTAKPLDTIMRPKRRERISISGRAPATVPARRSEEHTSELQSLMRNSYAVFCLKKKKKHKTEQ